jgi:hypothetical protein
MKSRVQSDNKQNDVGEVHQGRREFLHACAVTTAAAAISCITGRLIGPTNTPTPDSVTDTPQPPSTPEPTATVEPEIKFQQALEGVNSIEAETNLARLKQYYAALKVATQIPPLSLHVRTEIGRISFLYRAKEPAFPMDSGKEYDFGLIHSSQLQSRGDHFLVRAGYNGYLPVVFDRGSNQVGFSIEHGPERRIHELRDVDINQVLPMGEPEISEMIKEQTALEFVRIYISRDGEFACPASHSVYSIERNGYYSREYPRSILPAKNKVLPKLEQVDTGELPFNFLQLGEMGFNTTAVEDAIKFVNSTFPLPPEFRTENGIDLRDVLKNLRFSVQYEAFNHMADTGENVSIEDRASRLIIPHIALFKESGQVSLFEELIKAYLRSQLDIATTLMSELEAMQELYEDPDYRLERIRTAWTVTPGLNNPFAVHRSFQSLERQEVYSTALISFSGVIRFLQSCGVQLESENPDLSPNQYINIALTALLVNEYTHAVINTMLRTSPEIMWPYLEQLSKPPKGSTEIAIAEEAISTAMMVAYLENFSKTPRSMEDILDY